MDLLIISATPRTNLELAKQIEKHASDIGLTAEIVELEGLGLPLYDPSSEVATGLPKAALDLAQKWMQAKSFCLVAPEYNGSVPPVLTNAIVWVSRTGKDWRVAFNQKLAMTASASGGGGEKAVSAMMAQLLYLGAIVMPRPVIVNANKPLNEEGLRMGLKTLHSLLNK